MESTQNTENKPSVIGERQTYCGISGVGGAQDHPWDGPETLILLCKLEQREREIMEKTTIIIMTPIFIILFVIILQAIKSMFDLSRTSSFVLAACVSILAIMGMVRYLNDTIDVILLPYAAMAIAILLLLFLSVIARYFTGTKVIDRTRKNNISRYKDEQSGKSTRKA